MTPSSPIKASASAALSSKNAIRAMPTSTQASTLADVLERVLDKGIVIAGDISVSVANTELLNIRIRLLISSVDKAREIGINWWENNPHFSAQTRDLLEANQQLQRRVDSLETELRQMRSLPSSPPTALTPTFDTEPELNLESLSQDL